MMLRPLVSVHDHASSGLPDTAIPARFNSVTAVAGSSNSVAPVTGRFAGVVDVDVLGCDDVEVEGAADADDGAEALVEAVEPALLVGDVDPTWTESPPR
jgi:hypothetical protein